MPNLYSHSRKHSQQDCLLKNRRGTTLRISRARLPIGLRAQNSKRHRPPNLESHTPNRITFLKIEETLLSESQEPDSQQDCFLKNRRGTALRISRARLLIGLHAQKSKRHRPLNVESQTPNRITFPKIEETILSESQESDSQQDFFSQKSKRHRSLNLENQIPDRIACSKIEEAPLSELREPDFLG
ncbi:hypothetical protein ACFX13_047672 [Malus domestica]